jgi:hypothetical protein
VKFGQDGGESVKQRLGIVPRSKVTILVVQRGEGVTMPYALMVLGWRSGEVVDIMLQLGYDVLL